MGRVESRRNLRLDLSEGYLAWTNLREYNLSGCDLRGCDLSEANLENANLSDALITHAALRNTNLGGATLLRADLSESDMVPEHTSIIIRGLPATSVHKDRETPIA